MSSQNDDGDFVASASKFPLEIQTAHPRHLDIDD